MPIDGCVHDFKTLANSVLPDHLRRLEVVMKTPLAMREFSISGKGVATILKQNGRREDFAGCYVLIGDKPVYVGISRSVFARLRQHVFGTTHFDASLAYRMAAKFNPHKKTRGQAMADKKFSKVFEEKREYLRSLKVAFVQIENPTELHLFEVFAALRFRTSDWNTFRTH